MRFWFGKSSETNEAPAPARAEPAAAPAPEPPIQAPPPENPPAVEPPTVTEESPAPAAAQPTAATRPAAASPNDRRTLYYQIMNALYDAILVLDENGHIVDSNERVESVLGHTRDDLWDVPVTDVVPALRSQVFLQMKDGLRDQRRVLVSAHCRRKDGSTFHGEIGAGTMERFGRNLVLSIRNIEKRTPPQQQRKPPVILKTRVETAPKAEQG